MDLLNLYGDGKWSTQAILPLVAMVFGGGYGKAYLGWQRARSTQHVMQYNMDEQNNMI
jgi:hypothetical protein